MGLLWRYNINTMFAALRAAPRALPASAATTRATVRFASAVADVTSHVEDAAEEARLRQDLADAHLLTALYGMDDLVWNHISHRWRDGFLITPGKMMYEEIGPDDIVFSGDSENPTANIIHEALYAKRPDVNSIMHIHSRDVLAVSSLEMGLQCYAQDTVPFYGRVNYYDWDGVSDDHDEQEALGNSLMGLTAEGYTPHTLLMRNHGATITGSSVGEAWVRSYYLDKTAGLQMDLLKSGAKINMPDPEVMRLNADAMNTGDMSAGLHEWAALKRMAARRRQS